EQRLDPVDVAEHAERAEARAGLGQQLGGLVVAPGPRRPAPEGRRRVGDAPVVPAATPGPQRAAQSRLRLLELPAVGEDLADVAVAERGVGDVAGAQARPGAAAAEGGRAAPPRP